MSTEQANKEYGVCTLDKPEPNTNVPVRIPPASGACAGEIPASGTAPKDGWTLAQVLVYAKAGNSEITETEIRQGGNAATPDGTNWSSGNVSTAACTGGECGSGASTVRALAFWERLAGEMPEEVQGMSGQVNFTGQCTESFNRELMKLPRPEVRCEARRRKGWYFFTLDPNAKGDGNRLVLGDGEDLQASLIECYVEDVGWRLHGDPYSGQVVSSLGTWKPASNPASVRHPELFQGALVLRQPQRRLVTVIHSENRRCPVNIRVDPKLPIFVATNVLPSVLRPHTGSLRIAVRVLK